MTMFYKPLLTQEQGDVVRAEADFSATRKGKFEAPAFSVHEQTRRDQDALYAAALFEVTIACAMVAVLERTGVLEPSCFVASGS